MIIKFLFALALFAITIALLIRYAQLSAQPLTRTIVNGSLSNFHFTLVYSNRAYYRRKAKRHETVSKSMSTTRSRA